MFQTSLLFRNKKQGVMTYQKEKIGYIPTFLILSHKHIKKSRAIFCYRFQIVVKKHFQKNNMKV